VPAIEVSREGFEWALADSCLSHDDGRPGWAERLRRSPVRIQWDPERGLRHEALPYRSIQVGLSGVAVRRYVEEWTLGFTDITDLVGEVRAAVQGGVDARELLPVERPYPLSCEPAETIGASVE
jgi:hypothetical protein